MNNDSFSSSAMTQIMMFRHLWTILPQKSFLTGVWLRDLKGTPLFLNCFAHVLSKAQNKYPYFKTYYRNVVLLSPFEHALLDQGSEEQRISYSAEVEAASGGKNRADWAKLEALRAELLAEYKKYFPSHKGLLIGIKYSPDEVRDTITILNSRFLEETRKK